MKNKRTNTKMTTKRQHPAAAAGSKTFVGATAGLALVGVVTGMQYTAHATELKQQVAAETVATSTTPNAATPVAQTATTPSATPVATTDTPAAGSPAAQAAPVQQAAAPAPQEQVVYQEVAAPAPAPVAAPAPAPVVAPAPAPVTNTTTAAS